MAADLQQATDEFYAALASILAGDAEPMSEVWSHADDITYMSPFGELLVGWDATKASWQAQADQNLGGKAAPEELQFFDCGDLGVVVGFERGHITIDGTDQPLEIRATSTWRREDGEWKMIGHHTDPVT